MRRSLSLLLLALPFLATAQESVRVVGVADGDTVRVLTKDKKQLRVRLNGIDAPEKSQPFGEKSRQWLAGKVFGKDVLLKADGLDRYGRTLGTLKLGDLDVNLESVRAGWSWWYSHYAPKRSDLKLAEQSARARKVGLWSQSGAVAPWDYRHNGPGATQGTVAEAPRPRRSAPVPNPVVVSETVYVTRTGHKYHRAGADISAIPRSRLA